MKNLLYVFQLPECREARSSVKFINIPEACSPETMLIGSETQILLFDFASLQSEREAVL
jgi:hypothetical protein